MCCTCSMNLLEDHERRGKKLCPQCGRFAVTGYQAQSCYHCFCVDAWGADGHFDCPVCFPIQPYFYDDDMKAELRRVLRARERLVSKS